MMALNKFMILAYFFWAVWAQQAPLSTTSDLGPAFRGAVFDPVLRSRILQITEEHNITGYSVGVLQLSKPNSAIASSSDSGEVRTEFAQWGRRNEEGDSVTKDTVIGLASVSKAFTAAALGLVIHDFANGRNVTPLPSELREITWDTKLKALLSKEWKLMDPWASEMTSIRDALAHNTGMPRHDVALFRNDTVLAAVQRMRYLRPAFELRQEWHYNNFGYAIAQALVERYSKQSLPDFVSRRILKPLNMTSTVYTHAAAERIGQPSQAFDDNYRRIPYTYMDSDIPLTAGMGGVLTTAPDMLRWARLLLGGFSGTVGDDIVPPSVREECMSAQVLLPKQWQERFGTGRVTYGFGWWQDEVAGVRRVYHSGDLNGVSSLFTLLPDHGTAIVQLANSNAKIAANKLVVKEIMGAMDILPKDVDTEASVNAAPGMPGRGRLDSRPSLSTSHSSADLAKFAGSYWDPGYGAYTVCAPPLQDDTIPEHYDRCAEVYSAYTTIENVTAKSETKLYGYLSRMPRLGTGYFTLTLLPTDDALNAVCSEETITTFELQVAHVFPEGYGADTRPFEYGAFSGDRPRAQFSVANNHVTGFGVFGLANQVLQRERRGECAQERAEVWFRAVHGEK